MGVAVATAALAFLLLCESAQATFPGTNGRIVFAEKPPGAPGPQIASVDPSGGNRLQLTTASSNPPHPPTNCSSGTTYQFDPSWSPDGGSIVFAFYGSVVIDVNGNCTLLDPSARQDIRVMSPDGTVDHYVAFQGGDLSSPPAISYMDPAFSPTGATVAFECPEMSPSPEQVDICAAPSSGPSGSSLNPRPTVLAGSPSFETDPTYAPDGRLLFVRGQTIWEQLTTGAEQSLNLTGTAPSVAPDNSSVAFAGTDGDIYLAPLPEPPTANPRRHRHRKCGRKKARRPAVGMARDLTNSPGVTDSSPAFSPNGQEIAYISDGTISVMSATGASSRHFDLPYPVASLDWGAAVPAPNPAPATTPKSKPKQHRKRARHTHKCKKRRRQPASRSLPPE